MNINNKSEFKLSYYFFAAYMNSKQYSPVADLFLFFFFSGIHLLAVATNNYELILQAFHFSCKFILEQ